MEAILPLKLMQLEFRAPSLHRVLPCPLNVIIYGPVLKPQEALTTLDESTVTSTLTFSSISPLG